MSSLVVLCSSSKISKHRSPVFALSFSKQSISLMIAAKRAREKGCRWVNLDGDAEPDPELSYYEH